MCFTSSLLEPRLRCAIGLLGALLAEGTLSGAELDCGTGDTPRVCGATLLPNVVDRYCFTCCLWACWMWYLVGFSRWVCTYSKVKTLDQRSCKDASDISCSMLRCCPWISEKFTLLNKKKRELTLMLSLHFMHVTSNLNFSGVVYTEDSHCRMP